MSLRANATSSRALVARTIEADNAFNAACEAAFADQPDAPLLGRIEAARGCHSSTAANAAVLALISAIIAGRRTAKRISRQSGKTAREAPRLRLGSPPHPYRMVALEGFKLQQHMELVAWSEEERADILDDIASLARDGSLNEEVCDD